MEGPKTTMAAINEITSVSVWLEFLNKYFKDRKDEVHDHIRYWFRGQSDSTWNLKPGVYRDGFISAGQVDADRLRKERHLSQDFRVAAAHILDQNVEDIDVYFLQQHHRMPTRLLDWSLSPLAALYFASDENHKCPGIVYCMDAYNLARNQNVPEIEYSGISTSRNGYLCKKMERIFKWNDDIKDPNFIMAVRPDRYLERVRLQSGCFTLHPHSHPELTQKHNHSLGSLLVPQNSKRDIRAELRHLGVTPFSIYGDLENLTKTLKTAHRIENK